MMIGWCELRATAVYQGLDLYLVPSLHRPHYTVLVLVNLKMVRLSVSEEVSPVSSTLSTLNAYTQGVWMGM